MDAGSSRGTLALTDAPESDVTLDDAPGAKA
jgi:hypothetical protein